MEGRITESTLDHFLAGKLRKTVLVDEIFFSSLPQFISGKDKVRFKLKNCVIDEASFVEGDANVHVYFYFRPPVDPNFDLEIELRDGSLAAAGGGKWGNIGELVDYDEELKSWILNLYNGGMIRANKKISVSPKEEGCRVEVPLKKAEKDWRDALSAMNATPRKIIEDLFNIANRIVTGVSNWQGKQVEPWNQVEITRGRPTPLIPAPAATGVASKLTRPLASSGGSSVLKLPPIPSEGPEPSGEGEAAGSATAPAGPPIICPMCGVENKAGSKVCFRCMNPLE
ncbi:MAG: Ran-binding zinc finger domain-containing protein [Promethearchaeati archaeon SRVP18_Atabeyarchaeia-1]